MSGGVCNNSRHRKLVGAGFHYIICRNPILIQCQCVGGTGTDPIIVSVPPHTPIPNENQSVFPTAPTPRVARATTPGLCHLCGKVYGSRSKLVRHVKKCRPTCPPPEEPIGSTSFTTTTAAEKPPLEENTQSASSQPGGSGSNPSLDNLEGMCLLCPNPVPATSQNADVEPEECIAQKKLLENVCNHFNLKNFPFPKGLTGSRFPICWRCHILTQELGNIPHNLPTVDEGLQKKVEILKKAIVELVEERHFVRTNMTEKMKTQWEPIEKRECVFTRLPEAILEAHAAKLAEMKNRKNEETLKKVKAAWSVDIQLGETEPRPSTSEVSGVVGVIGEKRRPNYTDEQEEPGKLKKPKDGSTMAAPETETGSKNSVEVIDLCETSSDDDDHEDSNSIICLE